MKMGIPTSARAPAFTVVPPGRVSDRTRVEARLALRNHTKAARRYQVGFYWDRFDPAHRISRHDVTVLPNNFALVRAWCETAEHAGKRKLLFRAETKDGSEEGSWPLVVIPSRTPALPLLQAGWVDPLALSREVYPRDRDMRAGDVRARIDAMRRTGMEIAIVSYVEYFGHFFYPSRISFHDRDVGRLATAQRFPFDVVETILEQADKNGMYVFLGLGRSGDTKLLWEFDKPDWEDRNRQALEVAKRVARELWERYHHHRSFYGWYLTHEMNDLARASAYYDAIAEYCHAFSPDKPVMVAPAGTPLVDKRSLARSRVDIFAYQDAVGAGYVPYQYTYKPEKRLAMLDAVYRGYRRAHEGTGKHLWADLEIWEMDGTAGYSGAYAPPFERVKKQIQIEAQHVELLTGYEFFGFMEPPGSEARLAEPRPRRLFQDYAAYVREVLPRLAAPRRPPPSPPK